MNTEMLITQLKIEIRTREMMHSGLHAFCIQSRNTDSGLIYITEKECAPEGGNRNGQKLTETRKEGKTVSRQGRESGQSHFIETLRGRYSRFRKLLMVSSNAVSFSKKYVEYST